MGGRTRAASPTPRPSSSPTTGARLHQVRTPALPGRYPSLTPVYTARAVPLHVLDHGAGRGRRRVCAVPARLCGAGWRRVRGARSTLPARNEGQGGPGQSGQLGWGWTGDDGDPGWRAVKALGAAHEGTNRDGARSVGQTGAVHHFQLHHQTALLGREAPDVRRVAKRCGDHTPPVQLSGSRLNLEKIRMESP